MKNRNIVGLLYGLLFIALLSACSMDQIAGTRRHASNEGIYIDTFEAFFGVKPEVEIYEGTPASLLQGTPVSSYEVVLGEELIKNPIFDGGEYGVDAKTTIYLPDPYDSLREKNSEEEAIEIAREAVFYDIFSYPISEISSTIFNNSWYQSDLVREPYQVLEIDDAEIEERDLELSSSITLSLSSYSPDLYDYVTRIHELTTRVKDAKTGYATYIVADDDRAELRELYGKLFTEGYIEVNRYPCDYYLYANNSIGLVLDTIFSPEVVESGTNNPDIFNQFIKLDHLTEGMGVYLYDKHYRLISYGFPETQVP